MALLASTRVALALIAPRGLIASETSASEALPALPALPAIT